MSVMIAAGSVAVLFIGCGGAGEGTGSTGQAASAGKKAGKGAACTSSSECKTGFVCGAGTDGKPSTCAYPPCSTDSECSSGLVCASDGCRPETAFARGHECSTDGECDEAKGLVCLGTGKCEPPVEEGKECSDGDCSDKLTCFATDPMTGKGGLCLKCSDTVGETCTTCSTDSECSVGFHCTAHGCQEKMKKGTEDAGTGHTGGGHKGGEADAGGGHKGGDRDAGKSGGDKGGKDAGGKGGKDAGGKGGKDAGGKGGKDGGGKGGKDGGKGDSGYAFIAPQFGDRRHSVELASGASETIPFTWHDAPGLPVAADLWVEANGRAVLQVTSVDGRPFARAGLDLVELSPNTAYDLVLERTDGAVNVSLVSASNEVVLATHSVAKGDLAAADPRALAVVLPATFFRTAVVADRL
jgi:hypothetical protein